MKKLAIITTHPIQYNAPLFRQMALTGNVQINVFYTWGEEVLSNKFDPGFGKIINWDIPLLEGYDFTFVRNISKKPGSHHYYGIINPSLISEINDWKPDSVLIYGWHFKSHLSAMLYFHGKIPVFFRGDSTLLDEKEGTFKTRVRSIFLKWIYRHVDIAFYTGSANRAYFEKFGLSKNQLVFAPHAVDNKRFESTGNALRQELKIADHSIVFLFCGKFEMKKDPGLLLESFFQIDDVDTYLLMVGNGGLEKNLKERVARFPQQLRERILFLGFQNQSKMPEIYKAGNVFVLPSSGPGETWGLSVNEAMASCLPVLVSDKCGCSFDMIHENINGFVFNAGDVDSLTDKMKILIKRKSELKQMGEASKKIISNWSLEHVRKAIENTVLAEQVSD